MDREWKRRCSARLDTLLSRYFRRWALFCALAGRRWVGKRVGARARRGWGLDRGGLVLEILGPCGRG